MSYNPPPGPPIYDVNYYGNQQPQQEQLQSAKPQVPPFDGVDDPPPQYTTFEQRFVVQKPKYNDLWATILFIINVLGFSAVSGLSLYGYSKTRRFQGGSIYDDKRNDFGLSTNTIILFAFVLAVGAAVSGGYLLAVRAFTKQIIWVTGILNIVFGIGTAVYYFARHQYGAAIVFLVFALFYAFCFWTWRTRIPFAVLMLETSIDVAKHFGHVFWVSAIGGLVAVGFAAWFSTTFVAVYVKYTPTADNPACRVGGGGCSKSKLVGLLVFVTFSGYWTSEVIKNVIHVSISGVYGSWYFCSRSPGGMPSHPTLGAFKRAMTYSFGSISFGSLVASIVQLLHQACSLAQRNELADGNIVGCVVFCILSFILGVVDWLVQFFNHYAYSYIALYGKAYIPAAKDTWKMMKSRGIDALINDCLVDPVLTMGAVFVGYLCALLAYLYLQFTNPAYNRTGSFTVVVMAFSFLIGLQICNIFLVPIKSGVSTIFTCMAHNPEVLMRDFPELYHKMVNIYPGVALAVSA